MFSEKTHVLHLPNRGGNFSHQAVTLKIRSKLPKSNKLLILFDLYRLANLVIFHPMVHWITCKHSWLNFDGSSLAVTLKIRSRSPKPVQLFIMSKCYIHAKLVKIRQLVYEIVHTSIFWLKSGSLSPTATLKNRSKSPKHNQLFIMSQSNILANLVKIHPPVHEIPCKQESVTPTPMATGSTPKTISPWGHNNCQKDAEANSVNLDKMAPDLSLHLPNLSVQILQIIIVMPFQDYFT